MPGARPAARVRWAATSVLLVVLVLVAGLGVRVWLVHDQTWDWRLNPKAAPAKVVYEGRDYRPGGDVARLENGVERDGRTSGGGIIYATPGDLTSMVIYVIDGDRIVEYVVMGGP